MPPDQNAGMGNFPELPETAVGFTPEEDKALRKRGGFFDTSPIEWEKSYPYQAIQTAHKTRQDTAKRHYQNALTFYTILSNGVDPQSGQALSDDAKASYQNMLNGAWDDLSKIAGLDKDTKNELMRRKEIMDQVLMHGHERIGQAVDFLAGPGGGGMGPQGAGGDGEGTGPVASPSDTPMGTGNMPPPPMFGSPPGLVAPSLAPAAQGMAGKRAETAADLSGRKMEAEAAGLQPGTPAYQYKVGGPGMPPIAAAVATYRRKDGSEFTGRASVAGIMNVDTGEIEPEAIKATAASQAAPTLYQQNGIPLGVKRDGQTLLRGDAGFTPEDEKFLLAGEKAHTQQQDEIARRQAEWQKAYVAMRGKITQYQVMDLQTGNPTFANSDEINANPGQYAPLAGAQNLVNRDKIFGEMDYTFTQLEKALDALDDAHDLNIDDKAKIALALREADPASAISALVNSGALSTLNPAQLNYVASIVAAQESVMSLRSIAGMGQGSDRMRAAIIAMLPGASTPTKAYGKRQMELVRGEINALHQAVPPAIKAVGSGNFPTPPGSPGAGGTTYKYYKNREGKFARATAGAAVPEGWTEVPESQVPANLRGR